MLKSMTGYGRTVLQNELGQFVAEVHSLNRKHLEISLSLPHEFQKFESQMRQWIGEHVKRGRVHLAISVKYSENLPINISVNLPFAKKIKEACDPLVQELQLPDSFISSILTQSPHLLVYEDQNEQEDAYKNILYGLTISSLQSLNEMRSKEGLELQKDIQNRMDEIAIHMQDIVELAPKQRLTFRKKLESVLNEFILGSSKDEGRILQEVCLFAEKVDISEEILRLCSHQKQFLEVLMAAETSGKKLDFLLQEMLRESNTICAKSEDAEIIHHSIDIKTELERIREQIQNVE